MSFISLGAILGTAAAEAAAGIGAVAGSIGSAIGGAAGAIGSGITALGEGLGAAGAAEGAGTAAGTAGGAGGSSFLGQAAALGLGATPETAVPVGSTVGSLSSGVGGGAAGEAGLAGSLSGAVPVGTVSNAAAVAAPATPTTLTSGGLTGYGHLGDTTASNVVSKGVEGVNQEIANAKTQKGETDLLNTMAAEDLRGSQQAKQLYSGTGSGFKGWAEGGIATIKAAKGGSVRLQNGDYIVPADVVSALGNGSSKAGAKYLTHLCNALHAGPPPKAGSLAKQRAKQRHTA